MRRFLISGLVVAAATCVTAAPTGYHILGEVKIGGEGGWDYLSVDGAFRRLYLSHATHVAVIDIDALKVVGDIPDTPGVHGIAIAPELNRGCVSNGRGNNVTMFDLKTLATLGQVAVGRNPDSIRYDAVSGRVFTFNGRSNDTTAIEAKTGKVAGIIALGGKPEFSIADGKGMIFANIEDTSEMVAIDTAALTVSKRYPLSPCVQPSGLAFDAKNRRLFSVCSNRVMAVSDPDARRVVASPAIGAGSDGVAFDPGVGCAFSSNGDGTLTVMATTAPAQGSARPSYLPDTFKVLVVGK